MNRQEYNERLYSSRYYQDYLAHHGIIGQKWGVRRFQNKDGTLTSAGKERYNKDNVDHSKNVDYKKEAKDAIWGSVALTAMSAGMAAVSFFASGGTSIMLYPLIGTGIGALATAVNTGDFLVHNHRAKKAEKLKKKIDEERETEKVDKKTGLHVYDDNDTRTIEEKMERVNPEYYNWDKNTENNCLLCSVAMELQNRGYDVSANKASAGYTTDVMKRWFKNTDTKVIDGSLSDKEIYNRYLKILTEPYNSSLYEMNKADSEKIVNDFMNELKTQNNSSGVFDVSWNGTLSGHEMFYKVENGEVTLYDGQCNKKTKPEDLYGKVWEIGYNRLDDKQIISKNIKEAVN